MSFELHPQLAQDSLLLTDWPLSQVRVMNDSTYPWFILVPRVNHIREIIDLSEEDQQQLWHESAFLSEWLTAEYDPHKLNVAALGNVVAQLHMHHVARFEDDAAWPAPIWGQQPMQPLAEEEVVRLRQLFADMTL